MDHYKEKQSSDLTEFNCYNLKPMLYAKYLENWNACLGFFGKHHFQRIFEEYFIGLQGKNCIQAAHDTI